MIATITLASGEPVRIDAADLDLPVGNRTIGTARWFAQRSHGDCLYALTTVYHGRKSTPRKTTVRMHRLILGADPSLQVDHINGDGLDNRRANLRAVTQSANQRNKRRVCGSSLFLGVTWHAIRGKWKAGIGVDGQFRHIGSFADEVEAAKAYDRAALAIDANWTTNAKAGRFEVQS